jgi:membrane-associated phospholipid phosphatase
MLSARERRVGVPVPSLCDGSAAAGEQAEDIVNDIFGVTLIVVLSAPLAYFRRHGSTSQPSSAVATAAPVARPAAATSPVLRTADRLMLAYLVLCLFLVRVSPGGFSGAWSVTGTVLLCITAMATVALVARRALGLPSFVRANLYRGVFVAIVIENYLMLRHLLPAVREDAVDAQLLSIDRWLFGESPAFLLQRFNHHGTVEWFAFFYFSYFVICAGYILKMIWIEKDPSETNRFAIGSLIVLNGGQLGYMLVPAFGPLRLGAAFDAPLAGGFWWDLVTRAVAAGSAMKDVFPSLHTALPLWFAGYATTRAMRDRRWRPVAVITGFFSANIIVSTMLLRWHYAIDVIAGITLAACALALSHYLARREAQSCARTGRNPAWAFGAPAATGA